MLLDTYEQQGRLFNTNFKEKTSAGSLAYRGELVLVEGEVADAQGRRKPPVVLMKGAVLLSDADKLKLLAGTLDEMAHITSLLELYQADFAPDMRAMLYVVNIAKPMVADIAGIPFILIPMTDGMVWNEMVDELKLEKGDFKGQSSGDKVITVLEAFKDYAPKYDKVSLEEAMTRTNDAKRESRGPV